MKTFDTPEPILVDADLGMGNVRIEASDRVETTVDVRPSDPTSAADEEAAQKTRVEYAGGRLSVSAPTGWHHWTLRRGGSIDVVIGLPEGSRAHLQAGLAGLHGRGRMGELRCKVGVGDIRFDEAGPVDLTTGAGDITVERVVGKADVVAGSGAVKIGSVEGTATVKNSNGDTSIGEVTGELRVKAANGKISVDSAHAGVVAKTAIGDIRIGEVERGEAVAESALGDVEVGIRDGVAAWLDLNAKVGRVHNSLGQVDGPGAGEETVEVRATTSVGDITVHTSSGSRAASDVS